MEAGKSQVSAPTDACLVRVCFLACRWNPSCCNRGGEREKENKFFSVSSYKGTNPILKAPASCSNYLPKISFPNTITLGIRFQHMNFERIHTFSPEYKPNLLWTVETGGGQKAMVISVFESSWGESKHHKDLSTQVMYQQKPTPEPF